MTDLRLRFNHGDQPDLVLGTGVHVLGRTASGLDRVENDQPWLLQLCNDRRGLWVTVADGQHGVHVNGRPIQQLALLRAGDSIHVDGEELCLLGFPVASDAPIQTPVDDAPGNQRLTLRGVGGTHHGRCISLGKPLRVGSAADADLRIEGNGIAPLHACIVGHGGLASLEQTAAEVQVNGHRVRQARLRAGDQVAFDAQHRFVLEGPPPAAAAPRKHHAFAEDADLPPAPPRRHWTGRIPWLLVAAVLLAGALSALLLFGAR